MLRMFPDWFPAATCHHTCTGLFPSTKPGTKMWCVSVCRHVPIIALLTDVDVWNMYFNAWVNTEHKFLMDGIIVTPWKTWKPWRLADGCYGFHVHNKSADLCKLSQEQSRTRALVNAHITLEANGSAILYICAFDRSSKLSFAVYTSAQALIIAIWKWSGDTARIWCLLQRKSATLINKKPEKNSETRSSLQMLK